MQKQVFWLLVSLTIFVGFLVHKDPASAQDLSADQGPSAPSATVLDGWSFELASVTIGGTAGTTPTITAGSAIADSGAQPAGSSFTGLHSNAATVWSQPVGNGSAKSLSSNTWSVGDYYQFRFDTTGYNTISITWDQAGSSTGPRDFKVQYSTDGTTFTDASGVNSTYQVLQTGGTSGTWGSATAIPAFTMTLDLSGVSTLNNQSSVYIRLVNTSTASIGGSTVALAGTDRVDNFTVSGTAGGTPTPSPTPAPAITSVSPNSGPTTGATSVTITGTDLSGTTAVNFGGTAATGVVVNSATSVTAISPAHTVGAVDVTVTTSGGTSATSANDQFTYTAPPTPTPTPAPAVTSVSPSSGSSAGGTNVTITGTNLLGATAVNFGGTAASFTVNGPTSISATSPAHSAGVVDVTVTTSGGTSSTSVADQFTFNDPTPTPSPTPSPAPSVTSVSPTSGQASGGTGVTITGTNLSGATAVTFGGTAATTFSVVSGTQIQALSPAHATGAVDVVVTTPAGTSTTSANDKFTYTPDPTPTPTPTPTTIAFSAGTYSVGEGDGHIDITVTRTGDTSGAATVDYTTADEPIATGHATQKSDYEIALGTLTFAPGEASKTFTVLIVDDQISEPGNETLGLALSNATGTGVSLGSQSTAELTIIDNDAVTATTNPYDNASFFVRQHYLDFLNREPDQSGKDFWTTTITQCGNDASCTEVNRVNVSAAFYLSIEFQQTGYFVYKAYKASFGNLAGKPVPIRYQQFFKDTQQIGRGIVVGQGNWQAQLDANKTAYAQAFVQTSDFLTSYPLGMSSSSYVDKLFLTAGVTPTSTERSNAINAYSSGDVAGRAAALRSVVESNTLQQSEFNRAFVLMQYFGYLRRNPDDAPDSDFTGYNFWLTKLNSFNGNYIQAELVKAFMESSENRQRFGSN